jgi:hypothetical protein
MTRLPTVQEYVFDQAVCRAYAQSALPEGPEQVYDTLRRPRLLTPEGRDNPIPVEQCVAEAWRQHVADQAVESGQGVGGGGGSHLLAAVHRFVDEKRLEKLVRSESRWWRRRFQPRRYLNM